MSRGIQPRRLLAGAQPSLEDGECVTLPIPFVDSHFFADGRTEQFQQRTAQLICGRCSVQQACLTDAIEHPVTYGVRGGENPSAIERLHKQHSRTGVAAARLAAMAIARQKPMAGLQQLNDKREGRLHPEPVNKFDELPTRTAWTDHTGLTQEAAKELNDGILAEVGYMSTAQVEKTVALLEYRIENLQMDLLIVRDVLAQRTRLRDGECPENNQLVAVDPDSL